MVVLGQESEHNHRDRLRRRRAPRAGKSIDVQQPAQQLRPRYAGTARKRRPLPPSLTPHPPRGMQLQIGSRLGLNTGNLPRRSRRQAPPHPAAVREHSMVANLMAIRERDQSRQPAQEVQGARQRVR